MIKRALEKLFKYMRYCGRKTFNIDNIRLHGVKINLAHKNISSELKNFFLFETYEGAEVSILGKHLGVNDVVMEVGAGIGFLSTFCAKKIGSSNVFAYEANPQMISKIKETYALNGVGPVINNVILAEKDGMTDFFIEKDFWSSSSVKRSVDSHKITVENRNINKEIQRINPTFMIMDIEGGESELIPVIDFYNIKKIIVEIHPHVIGEEEASELIQYLISCGFCLKLLENRGTVLFFAKTK